MERPAMECGYSFTEVTGRAHSLLRFLRYELMGARRHGTDNVLF